MSIAQVFAKFSVRTRIVALGAIPLVGFLAYGLAYVASDLEVGRAFDSVHRDTALVDASSDLKASLLAMRVATTEFAARPSDDEVASFAKEQALARGSLDRIEAQLPAAQQGAIMPLRITVRDLKASFDSLVRAQRALGFNEAQGETADL